MEIENNNEKTADSLGKNMVSRRGFLKVVGVFTIGASGVGLFSCDEAALPSENASMGYILVDSRKCQGCLTCMISCSLVNEGSVSLSLSRIQVSINSFGTYPDDVRTTQCRQCEDPKCVTACPNGALIVDEDHGNIRLVNPIYCIGCGRCVQACPYEPERPMVAPDDRFDGRLKSRKCDLCLNAPYHFDSKGGGVDGVRACEALCPLGAIKFSTEMPVQEGNEGYEVNLRDNAWKALGFDTEL
ncbi:MAG: 4Fe-4S dicluster domain-containing protein [Proteobacteria bacterium]|nr:4Fe-4S dicluster domain-containing protein [Pseudomonadota bacterium]